MNRGSGGVVAAGLAALIAMEPARAGAWPMPAGEGQAITTISLHDADRGFDDDGQLDAQAAFSKSEISIFLEHGLSDAWTLVARPAWQSVSIDGVEAQGWAATEIGARRSLWLGEGWATSVQLGAFAAGSAENRADARLGEGGSAIELRGLAGRSWGRWMPGFVDVQAAWRDSFDDLGDEARLDLTLGVEPVENWSIFVQSFSLRRQAQGVTRELDSDRLAVSLVNDLGPRWRLQTGALTAIDGRNVIEEKAVFASLWLRY